MLLTDSPALTVWTSTPAPAAPALYHAAAPAHAAPPEFERVARSGMHEYKHTQFYSDAPDPVSDLDLAALAPLFPLDPPPGRYGWSLRDPATGRVVASAEELTTIWCVRCADGVDRIVLLTSDGGTHGHPLARARLDELSPPESD